MLADNTDYSGCRRAFEHQFGVRFKPGKVLMLGAGGVGVAIAHALKELGLSELIIHDTDLHAAGELITQMSGVDVNVRLAGKDLVGEARQADGLVNATPVGMFQYPGNPFPEDAIGPQSWAFDAVYTPENTAFLSHCRQCDIATLSGFYLFLFQGLDAFERFVGIKETVERVEPIFSGPVSTGIICPPRRARCPVMKSF